MKKAAAKKVSKTAAASPRGGNSWDIQDKTLKEFERGINSLHRQNYAEALERFQALVDNHPQEKELLDRLRIYVRICNDMLNRKPAQPKRPEDAFYFGVMKANDAEYDEAVKYLDRALQANPKDEKVHYVMASTLALQGSREEAVRHLRQAIELNDGNRIYARNDPDFEPLRDDEQFQNLIHPEEM
jgi:tetratricopeptide (TPR) repeat protein